MKRIRGWTVVFVLSCIAGISPALAQKKMTISGFVKDKATAESLIGASVIDAVSKAGTTTNAYGFFSLTVPVADTVLLMVSYVGYSPQATKVSTSSNIRVNVLLDQLTSVLDEIEVSATRNDDNVNRSQVGVITVPMTQIKNMPVLAGERDILKVIQFLPGVQQAQEGTTGFFVRGGNIDQNLVQLDEATIYNPNHLFGLVSTFNVNSLNNVQLIKGGFPAQFGGRLSSILDVTMKDGNREKFQGEGGIGLLAANLTLQGPVAHKKGSFIVSARRSYFDLFEKAIAPSASTLYMFYDLNAKLNFDLGRNDKIFISAFKGRDNGSYNGSNSLNYGIGFGNATATLRWNHLFGSRLFVNTSLIANDYNLGLNTTQGNYYSLLYTGIRDLNGKTDFTWLAGPESTIKFGATYFYHTLFPASFSSKIPKKGDRKLIDVSKIPHRYSHESALYINHELDPTKVFGINYGLRAPYFVTRSKTYVRLEPRVTLRFRIDPTTSLKGSFTIMNQFLHVVPYSTASLPTDLWISSSSNVKPQTSTQYSFGVFKSFTANMYETSIEGYYKDMHKQVLFKQGTQVSLATDIEHQLTFGNGTSKGIELFIRKTAGRLTGWFSYTLSKTTQIFPDLNHGNPFPFTYDRRHNLAVVANYDLNKKWTVSADFTFRSGSAYTLPAGLIPVAEDGTLYDGRYYDYTSRNNARLKAYHRLDVNFVYKKNQKFFGRSYDSELVFGAYNIYARQNPYFVYLTVNQDTKVPSARQVSLLTIVPSISYNFKF